MAMQLPGGAEPPPATKVRGHGGHAAQAYNADTHTYIDSKGHPHPVHPGDKVPVDAHMMVFAHGHPAMPYHMHVRQKTAVHKRMRAKGNPHPNDLMKKMLPLAQAADALPAGPMPPAPQGLPGGMAALRGV